MEMVHSMFKDSVETGREFPTVKPGNITIHTVVGPSTLAKQSWRRYGVFREAGVGKEIIIDFARVEDVRLRLSAVSDATPDEGSIDL